MDPESIDRMAIAIVDGTQASNLLGALQSEGFRATPIDAVGGFLHDALVTLLVGMPAVHLPRFFALVRRYCPSRVRYVPVGVELALTPGYPMMIEARVGGATVFVIPVERFLQL